MQEPDRVPVFFYMASCARILHMDIDRNIQQVALDNYLWGSSADDVTVGAALDADGGVLHVRFSVSERELRRMVWEPNGKVWTDSCVEVFVKNTDSDEYSNFEFSATGAFLAAHGAGRRDRVRYSDQERSRRRGGQDTTERQQEKQMGAGCLDRPGAYRYHPLGAA